jgi:hypothetical protein
MMKKLLLLAFIAVAGDTMAQDVQCVGERAAMIDIIRDAGFWGRKAFRSASWSLWSERSTALANCLHAEGVTAWPTRASKKARSFATSAGLRKSGCGWAVALTLLSLSQRSRAEWIGGHISAV